MKTENAIHGFQLYLLLTAIALAAFLVSLDGFIVNVAIPTISGELGVPDDVGTWIITLFSTASTVFIPIAGYLSTRYSNIRLFIIALTVFMIGSFLAGFSHNFSLLLCFRVVQGASAGILTPISLALIITHFPLEKRSVAIGFWNFFVIVGPAMGPMIGGWLSDYHWPWMFYLNIPICFFSLATVIILLRSESDKKSEVSLDIVGLALLFTWVGAIQVATNRWNIDDWFRSPFITSLFILALICFVFFIVWEIFYPQPLINFSQLKKRNFALPSLTTALAIAMLFSSFVLDSLWVQEVLGYTPGWAGLTLTPVGIFPLIVYPLLGRFVGLLDLRIWVIISFLLYACTFFWLSNINIYTSFWHLALPRLVQGVGFALFTIPNALLTTRGAPPEKLTSVIALYSFIRLFLVGIGVALAITLWIFRETFYQDRLTARTIAFDPIMMELLAPFESIVHSTPQSQALAYNTIVNTASTLALADIYYLYAWLFLGLSVVVLFYKRIN